MLIFPLFQFIPSSINYPPPTWQWYYFAFIEEHIDASVVLVISRLHQWPQKFKASTTLDLNQLAGILIGKERREPQDWSRHKAGQRPTSQPKDELKGDKESPLTGQRISLELFHEEAKDGFGKRGQWVSKWMCLLSHEEQPALDRALGRLPALSIMMWTLAQPVRLPGIPATPASFTSFPNPNCLSRSLRHTAEAPCLWKLITIGGINWNFKTINCNFLFLLLF